MVGRRFQVRHKHIRRVDYLVSGSRPRARLSRLTMFYFPIIDVASKIILIPVLIIRTDYFEYKLYAFLAGFFLLFFFVYWFLKHCHETLLNWKFYVKLTTILLAHRSVYSFAGFTGQLTTTLIHLQLYCDEIKKPIKKQPEKLNVTTKVLNRSLVIISWFPRFSRCLSFSPASDDSSTLLRTAWL